MAIIDESTVKALNESSADKPADIAARIKEVIFGGGTVGGVPNKGAFESFILPIAAFVILAFGIYGGILYFTAYGSEEKATKGKNTIIWAAVGAIVVALAWVLIRWWAGTIAGENNTITIPGGTNIQGVTNTTAGP